MKKHLLLTSALFVTALQVGCAVHDHRGAHMKTKAKPDMAPCSTNNDCRVSVYATIGADQGCNVHVLFDTVTIVEGKHPKVVWRIEPADPAGDPFKYRFAFDPTAHPPVYGVEIVGNVPSQDFDAPGYDHGKDKFQWKSKHLRRMSFPYKLNVERSPDGNDPWSSCALLDPRIAND